MPCNSHEPRASAIWSGLMSPASPVVSRAPPVVDAEPVQLMHSSIATYQCTPLPGDAAVFRYRHADGLVCGFPGGGLTCTLRCGHHRDGNGRTEVLLARRLDIGQRCRFVLGVGGVDIGPASAWSTPPSPTTAPTTSRSICGHISATSVTTRTRRPADECAKRRHVC